MIGCDKVGNMKITELAQLPKNKWGKFLKNGVKLEPHEEKTAKYLVKYGFIVDVIRPMNTPKVHNPDFLIGGAIWEVKAPIKYNKNTIKNRIKEAAKQADRIIFDLRNIKTNYMEAEKEIIKLFMGNQNLRRMILITKSGKTIDFFKR